jgi:hypothetical protein
VEPKSPGLNAALATVVYVIVVLAGALLTGREFDLVEILMGGVTFWVVYSLVQAFVVKKLLQR